MIFSIQENDAARRADIEHLKTENRTLAARVTALEAQVRDLRDQLQSLPTAGR